MLLGRFAGIDVRVHATFALLFAWFGLTAWSRTGTLSGVAVGFATIVLLFLCVLLHEYGHALTARRYGIATRDITLLPIGGVAMLERMPEDPRQEIVVALAGPAVNVAIAAVLAGLAALDVRLPGGMVETLLAANLMLAAFNLLPAFPMDGGRVLRALLAMRFERLAATRAAVRIGQVLALGLGVAGFFGSPLLILIGVFVWFGAQAELAAAIRLAHRRQPRPAPPPGGPWTRGGA